MGQVGEHEVVGDRRHLVQAGLAELALHVVLVSEAEAANEPDGYFHEELAECLHASGRADEAKPHFRRAYEELSKDNPGLVMLRISGYGQTGPNSHKPGFGTVAEGYAGYVHITGYPDRPPLLPGFVICQHFWK